MREVANNDADGKCDDGAVNYDDALCTFCYDELGLDFRKIIAIIAAKAQRKRKDGKFQPKVYSNLERGR